MTIFIAVDLSGMLNVDQSISTDWTIFKWSDRCG